MKSIESELDVVDKLLDVIDYLKLIEKHSYNVLDADKSWTIEEIHMMHTMVLQSQIDELTEIRNYLHKNTTASMQKTLIKK